MDDLTVVTQIDISLQTLQQGIIVVVQVELVADTWAVPQGPVPMTASREPRKGRKPIRPARGGPADEKTLVAGTGTWVWVSVSKNDNRETEVIAGGLFQCPLSWLPFLLCSTENRHNY